MMPRPAVLAAMDKFIKQLKRDFQKNPKKVVLLGVLGVVCLWVCLPLVLPKEEKKPVRKSPVVAAVAASSPSASAQAAAPAWRWQDLDRYLNEDPRMRVAAPLAAAEAPRNPFEADIAAFDIDAAMDEYLEEAAAEAEQQVVKSAPNRSLLDAVPLALSSTVVRGELRSAVINGRVFREGDRVTAPGGEPLVLAIVEPRRAVVEWQGLSRELRILKPGEMPAKPNLTSLRAGS
jgi:hypothetical protein